MDSSIYNLFIHKDYIIKDIKIDNNILYVLEQEKGIFALNIDNVLDPKIMDIMISFKNGKSFDIYKNTIILIVSVR